ncbi:MAG: aldehyde dehydrogenase family protein, partial [Synechococcus sp.]
MKTVNQLYINGQWVDARGTDVHPVINPATEQEIAHVQSASEADVNDAVAAAKAAFGSFSQTTLEERGKLLEKLLAIYERRRNEFAATLTEEMGSPISFSETVQTALGVGHIQATINALKDMKLEEVRGPSLIVREAAGVAGLITPWNFPINQIFTKVASALGAGCTMVLKPSEIAPLDAILFAEMMDEAGVPAGVFNLVFGDGPGVGSMLSRHPDIEVISFTGSTRAAREISKDASDTIKMVHLELGGKSPNVILDDADFATAVPLGLNV